MESEEGVLEAVEAGDDVFVTSAAERDAAVGAFKFILGMPHPDKEKRAAEAFSPVGSELEQAAAAAPGDTPRGQAASRLRCPGAPV